MPYIEETRRKNLDKALEGILYMFETVEGIEPGDLAYALTRIAQGFIKHHGKSYTSMSATVGVIETVKHEIQRRMLDPYEDKKKEIHGDVF